MTEKFMKLSEFFKLIKKEDEAEVGEAEQLPSQEGVNAAAEGQPAGEQACAQPSADNAAAAEIKAEAKMTEAELSVILEQYGWKPQQNAEHAQPKEHDRRTKATHDRQQHPDNIKDLFKSMDTEVIKELFTPEEVKELTHDERTQVFTTEDIKNISEISQRENAETSEDNNMTRLVPKVDVASGQEAGKKQSAVSRHRKQKREDEWGGRAVRRTRRYKTGCLGGLMYFGFVLCVSVILASLGWLAANDVLSLNKPIVSAEITVDDPGEGRNVDIEKIAQQLHEKGIIEYKGLFKVFSRFADADEKIDPGTYELNSGLDYRALVAGMQQYTGWSGVYRETVKVMIPEGKTVRESFEILAQNGVCSADKLMEAAAELDFDYDFLADNPLEGEKRLEGYLFPDTYEFYVDSEPRSVIEKLLDNFDSKVTDEMFRQAEAMGYSMHDIITVASLIEMEAGTNEERATIASVIYNRLNSNYYPYLQIDASVIYALGERKEEITYNDRMINDPYNTFMYEGLPPGAIANPGLASIRAALAPEETGYYFYALGKGGSHEFFSSYTQFENFVNSSDFGG